MPDTPVDTPAGAPALAPVLEARGVDVRLGQSRVVRAVDLVIHRGEMVALMGANGSGKSTLVRALVGILPVATGTIRLFGVELAPTRGDVPWHRLGYVPQSGDVGGGIPATALEVVTSGLLHRRRIRPPHDAKSRGLRALGQVGLAERAHRSVRELSGGQQQRVLIARALVREPDLLVLDEPVAGVDAPSQSAFARTLAQLAERGVTVLTVAHELGTLTPLVHRTVVLRHGAVVHDGAPLPPAPGHDAPEHVHLHPSVEDREHSPLGSPILGAGR